MTLDVAWLKPIRRSGAGNQFAVIAANTWDEDKNKLGGEIPIVVKAAESERLLARYESKPDGQITRFRGVDLDTKRLSGTLRRGAKGVLFIDLTEGAATPASLNLAGEIEQKIADAIKERLEALKNANGN